MLENSSNRALGRIFKLKSIWTSGIVRSLEKNLHFLPCFTDVSTKLWAFLQHTIHFQYLWLTCGPIFHIKLFLGSARDRLGDVQYSSEGE